MFVLELDLNLTVQNTLRSRRRSFPNVRKHAGRILVVRMTQLLVRTGILTCLSCARNSGECVGLTILALLSGTLKTYQRAACDEETMTLKCPLGTTISVTVARYGRADAASAGKCATPYPTLDEKQANRTCFWPNALQYSLLQTVVEVCQKKRQCKFNTSPKTFQGDPCPGQPKYIEVAYKCRPYEFRSKIACENDVINLKCYPGRRVAIYSASFGRTEYESVQCPQPHGVMEETCTVSYATETVMNMCHGKRHCSVAANSTTFGDPCKPDSRMYLKVVYTCVETRYKLSSIGKEGKVQKRLRTPTEDTTGMMLGDTGGNNKAELSTLPPTNCTTVVYAFPEEDRVVVGYLNEWINAYSFISKNQEKFYLYIIVSSTAGILLFLGVVIGRLLVSRHRAKRDAKFHANNEPLPNGFTDDISEIDADIDLTTPAPVSMQDTRLPETQLAERLHGERYYGDARIPLSPSSIHGSHQTHPSHPTHQIHHSLNPGVRVDLGNHMVGTDSLHTILRSENPRSLTNKSYYYG
ncbi:protein eva-1 homolog C isoform X8 [Cephus cinctus]|uniref:Protein eva-1 homolog C isoform X8 n=1 Tax=Cephus cinctus TaxID=211228 RepID=A0AAJ7RGE7_CEPCN|nr:protein eva-1 homolog C isoform X8 [Cephus cinctus]